MRRLPASPGTPLPGTGAPATRSRPTWRASDAALQGWPAARTWTRTRGFCGHPLQPPALGPIPEASTRARPAGPRLSPASPAPQDPGIPDWTPSPGAGHHLLRGPWRAGGTMSLGDPQGLSPAPPSRESCALGRALRSAALFKRSEGTDSWLCPLRSEIWTRSSPGLARPRMTLELTAKPSRSQVSAWP